MIEVFPVEESPNKDILKTIDFKDIKEGEGIYIKNKDLE